jgi:glycosyltransferase involved in cell wall biosynthesis
MKRIGIITSNYKDLFRSKTTGLRVATFAFYRLLSKNYKVDLLLPVKIDGKEFFKKLVNIDEFLPFNGFYEDVYIENPHTSILPLKFQKRLSLNKLPKIKPSFESSVIASYDYVLIDKPWATENLIMETKVIGFIHDIVFTKLRLMQGSHGKAIRTVKMEKFYNLFAKGIFCVSEKTREDYLNFYGISLASKVFSIPPLFYPTFYEAKILKKENSLVMANIFDKRKGIELVPEILKHVKGIKTIYIYGAIREKNHIVKSFILGLPKNINVIMFESLTQKSLIEILCKCKALLFPSYNEGLGSPIIEAQLCGVIPIVQNISPMKDIILDKNYILSGNFEKDGKIISKLFTQNNYDFIKLQRQAFEAFSQKSILNEFKKIIN